MTAESDCESTVGQEERMAPKTVKLKLRPLAKGVKAAVKKLKAVRPKVSAAGKKSIDLEIKELQSFETAMYRFCRGTMTHTFISADDEQE
jgi:hypothetical protein